MRGTKSRDFLSYLVFFLSGIGCLQKYFRARDLLWLSVRAANIYDRVQVMRGQGEEKLRILQRGNALSWGYLCLENLSQHYAWKNKVWPANEVIKIWTEVVTFWRLSLPTRWVCWVAPFSKFVSHGCYTVAGRPDGTVSLNNILLWFWTLHRNYQHLIRHIHQKSCHNLSQVWQDYYTTTTILTQW